MPIRLPSDRSQSKELITVAWISSAGTFIVLGLKFIAYQRTHSDGVFSDVVESIVDLVGAWLTVAVMRVVAQPADVHHPYGHGKLEYFSAAFDGGLIAFAAVYVAFQAVHSFFEDSSLQHLEDGIVFLALTVFINVTLSWYIQKKGKQSHSEALLAKAKHVFADVVTTGAVILGLLLVKITGVRWLDGVAALFIAFHLMREGWLIVRKAVGGLIDETDVHSLQALAKAFEQARQPGIIDIHQLKVIRSGRFHHVDAHAVLPQFWDVAKANELVIETEERVVQAYPNDGEVAFHLDPCQQAYCRSCDLPDCPIRKESFVERIPFTPAHLISKG